VSADDHRLIAECLEGNTASFGALVRRYQDRLYNTVYRLVDNAEDAQDVVQEAFLNAYQSLDSFKGGRAVLHLVVPDRGEHGDQPERKKRVLARIPDRNGEAVIEPADPSELNRPGYALEQAEQEQQLHRGLARLSPEHKAVLVMKELEGQKYEEIAETLGCRSGPSAVDCTVPASSYASCSSRKKNDPGPQVRGSRDDGKVN